MEKANGDGGKATGYTFALLAFEAAWEPADLHVVAQAAGTASASANGANGAGKTAADARGAADARRGRRESRCAMPHNPLREKHDQH